MKRVILSAAMAAMAVCGATADNAATYPGGEEAMKSFIVENLKYPAMAKDNGIEGVVSLTVSIKADGTVGSIKVDHMIDPDLEQEAIRIVKMMPSWTPAVVDGAAAASTVKVTVPFLLSE